MGISTTCSNEQENIHPAVAKEKTCAVGGVLLATHQDHCVLAEIHDCEFREQIEKVSGDRSRIAAATGLPDESGRAVGAGAFSESCNSSTKNGTGKP